MILAHAIIGLTPVDSSQFSWFWFLGSVIPDVDHLFTAYKYKIFTWHKIVESVRTEAKSSMNYKSKYFHSIFGAVLVSLPAFLINPRGGKFFFIAYLIHLLLDWPDIEEKYFLYPLKIKFKGRMTAFSRYEVGFTLFFIILLLWFWK